MKRIRLTLFILFVYFCVIASAKGKSKDDKPGKNGKASLTGISTCMGQSVQIGTVEITNAVEGCLANRVQEVQEQVEAEVLTKTNGKKKEKAEKKLAKRKEKLEKKVRRKCVMECEWNLFDMIPEMNGTSDPSIYPSVAISKSLLDYFPVEAQESLKTGMESCYNITSPAAPKNGKKFKVQKVCLKNKKLIRCFWKSIRKTCNGKASDSSVQMSNGQTTETPLSTPVGKSGLENMPSSTSKILADEEGDDEDDDDDLDDEDDENDDEEEGTTVSGISVSVTAKSSMPASQVDTSQPITK